MFNIVKFIAIPLGIFYWHRVLLYINIINAVFNMVSYVLPLCIFIITTVFI